MRGTKSVKVHDAEKILDLPYPKYALGVDALDEYLVQQEKAFTGYFKGIEWADLEKTRAVPYLKKRMVRQTGCCPLSCIGLMKVPGVGTSVMRCDPF